MKRCRVIGGAGFIGRQVTRILCGTDREVVVLGRSERANCDLPSNCLYISGDYADRALLRGILQPGCEVIDLAYSTVPKTSFDDPVFDLVSNLPASVGLFQEALTARVSCLVTVSSGGTVYGPTDRLPICESQSTNPVSPYGITKCTIDLYAMMFHRTAGLPVVVVRPATAYGENQRIGSGQGFIAAATAAIHAGREIEIYGQEGTIRDYIHVFDVATGIVAALDHGKVGEVYNLGTGIGTSNAGIIKFIEPLARKAGASVLTKILPPRKFDVEANILDSAKLRTCAGWAPAISLEQGIARAWEAGRSKNADLTSDAKKFNITHHEDDIGH